MSNHPMSGFISGSIESIKDLVDVNTIVGETVQAPDGTLIIPISRVGFGFAAGGGEYAQKGMVVERTENGTNGLFGGGVGAGVSINPIGFLVVGHEQIKFIPVSSGSSTADKLVDYIPLALEKINRFVKDFKKDKKKEQVDSEKNE